MLVFIGFVEFTSLFEPRVLSLLTEKDGKSGKCEVGIMFGGWTWNGDSVH